MVWNFLFLLCFVFSLFLCSSVHSIITHLCTTTNIHYINMFFAQVSVTGTRSSACISSYMVFDRRDRSFYSSPTKLLLTFLSGLVSQHRLPGGCSSLPCHRSSIDRSKYMGGCSRNSRAGQARRWRVCMAKCLPPLLSALPALFEDDMVGFLGDAYVQASGATSFWVFVSFHIA